MPTTGRNCTDTGEINTGLNSLSDATCVPMYWRQGKFLNVIWKKCTPYQHPRMMVVSSINVLNVSENIDLSACLLIIPGNTQKMSTSAESVIGVLQCWTDCTSTASQPMTQCTTRVTPVVQISRTTMTCTTT